MVVVFKTLGMSGLVLGGMPVVFYRVMNAGVAGLLIGGAVCLVLAKYWSRLPRALLRPIRILAGLAGAFGLFLSGLMIWAGYLNPPPESCDAVVVLGGQIRGDQPSLMLARRLDKAAEYLQNHPGAFCVVSGGQGPDEDYPEAIVMQEYLRRRGISPERITPEANSTNTLENLMFSKRLLPPEETGLAIATDGFHQLRAGMYARSQGFAPYSLPAFTPPALIPAYWVREWMAIPKAFLETARMPQPAKEKQG